MAIHQPGIAITIKGFLPTGKTIEEQFTALSIVKTAHETGDYAPLLKAAQNVEVKTEQKTRRIEEPAAAAPAAAPDGANVHGIGPDEPTGPNPDFAELSPDPAEDIYAKAKRLGVAWNGRNVDQITADIAKVEEGMETTTNA